MREDAQPTETLDEMLDAAATMYLEHWRENPTPYGNAPKDVAEARTKVVEMLHRLKGSDDVETSGDCYLMLVIGLEGNGVHKALAAKVAAKLIEDWSPRGGGD